MIRSQKVVASDTIAGTSGGVQWRCQFWQHALDWVVLLKKQPEGLS